MKKRLPVLILALVMALSACSLAGRTGGSSLGDILGGLSGGGGPDGSAPVKPIEVETADYIQSAIDCANLIASNDLFQTADGDLFFSGNQARNYAGFCFGKEIKQLRQNVSTDMLTVLEDGSVYNGNTLVTDQYVVKDVLWSTNNVNVNAILLTVDGKRLQYFPDSDKVLEERAPFEDGFIVGTRYRNSYSLFLTKDGEAYGSVKDFPGVDVTGWKNVVVLACMKPDEDADTATVAGIAGDGTVYATGEYADDILSWGELAYITMDEQLIVGLKKDGTLAFTGPAEGAFSHLSFENVRGVRVWDGRICAIADGGFYADAYEHATSPREEVPFYTFDQPKGYRVLHTDGTTGNAPENTVYLNPAQVSPEYMVYYYALTGRYVRWVYGSGPDGDGTHDPDRFKYLPVDLDQDGTDELLLYCSAYAGQNNMSIHMAVGCCRNGQFGRVGYSSEVKGYYPNSGILCVTYYFDIGPGWGEDAYLKYDCGKLEAVIEPVLGHDLRIGEDYVPEGVEKVDGYYKLTEEQYDQVIRDATGGEEMIPVSLDDFLDLTEENLERSFLSA